MLQLTNSFIGLPLKVEQPGKDADSDLVRGLQIMQTEGKLRIQVGSDTTLATKRDHQYHKAASLQLLESHVLLFSQWQQ